MTRARDVLQKLKEKLEAAGIKATYRGDSLWLEDPPVPRLVPFDRCTAQISPRLLTEITQEADEKIYFSLDFYFCSLLADFTNAEEYEERYQQFVPYSVDLHGFLDELVDKYGLHWDFEADECFEESIWGDISPQALLDFFTDLNQLVLPRKQSDLK